jgi:hypothetical protein
VVSSSSRSGMAHRCPAGRPLNRLRLRARRRGTGATGRGSWPRSARPARARRR